jgi:Leucine-rich repeat (LRR) protein
MNYCAIVLVLVTIFKQLCCQHFDNIDIRFVKNDKRFVMELANEINRETEVTDVRILYQNVSRLKEDSFKNLFKLKVIKIKNCGLGEIENNAFNNLPSLRVLNLNQNRLKFVKRAYFDKLPITRLYLAANGIEALDEDAFHHLKYLEMLDLSRNDLKDLHSHMFRGTTQLRRINLSFNKLETIPNECFMEAFGSVVGEDSYINLSDNQLTYLNLKALKGVYNLKKLDLKNNYLEQLDPNIFNEINYLGNLDIQNNYLQSLNDNILKHLQTSHTINFYANPWNCSFVKKCVRWLSKYHKTGTFGINNLLFECNI